jgi:spermidine synthase
VRDLLAARPTRSFQWGTMRVPLTIFIGGINLIVIQWIMIRELTMLLLGTELVILLVSIAYFAGLSVGFFWSGKIRPGWLPALAAGTLILHLTLPVLLRLLSGWLYSQHTFWIAFVVLPLLMPFAVSSFYSILLPLYIDNGQGRLVDLYAVELLGAAAGILLLIGVGSLGLTSVYVPYTLFLLVLLASLGLSLRWLVLLTAAAAIWLIGLTDLDARSNAYWFGKVFALARPKTLFSAYSPYQKVDILEDVEGQRYLFLNGLIDYGTDSWKRLNVALGKVPAQLIRPKSMVTVGSGSMALEGLVADYVGHVTTVELDPVVLSASRQQFAAVNRVDQLQNWSYVIDDAKHFFANTTDSYDLVTMNVPAPLTAQTATLYSSAFYAGVKTKLNPGGVLAVSLTRPLRIDNTVARRIAAGVLANFKQAIAITPRTVGITFIFASDALPFTVADVEQLLRQTGEETFSVMDETALRVLVGSAAPITLDTLNIALEESARRVRSLLEP